MKYTENHIPIFGSFGFGFFNKGFDRIIHSVNDQYDNAIIKLIITVPDYETNKQKPFIIAKALTHLPRKKGIILMITHEFFTQDELLYFLSLNTLNIFLYDYMPGRGISSVIDYALSVNVPIGISNSVMFRHIYNDCICLYTSSISQIINNVDYLNQFKELYSDQKLISKFESLFQISYSQCYQDIFVMSMLQHKQGGYFVEIGSNHHKNYNNSYILEKMYNWSGLLVEYDACFKDSYIKQRCSSIYKIGDAQALNYIELLKDFPKAIDYLQIDLDVNNKSTLNTLYNLDTHIFDNYKFATITFEHDIYSGNHFETRQKSRELFKNRGYILIFPDVCVFWEGEYRAFEDWYIHPDLVDCKYVLKNYILTERSNANMKSEDIKNLLCA